MCQRRSIKGGASKEEWHASKVSTQTGTTIRGWLQAFLRLRVDLDTLSCLAVPDCMQLSIGRIDDLPCGCGVAPTFPAPFFRVKKVSM